MRIRKLICVLLLAAILTACAAKAERLSFDVTMDTVSDIETLFQFSVVKNGMLNQIDESNSEIAAVKELITRWAMLQTNRSYTTITGEEEYETYHQSYISKINEDIGLDEELEEISDAEHTVAIYNSYKLKTSFVEISLNQVIIGDGFAYARVNVTDRVTDCKSDKIATNIGYVGGIGDFKSRIYYCTLIKTDGEYLIYDITQRSST